MTELPNQAKIVLTGSKKSTNSLAEKIATLMITAGSRELLGAFLIGNRLEDYIECFMAINRFPRPRFPLNHITSPRESGSFGGGGPYVPSIDPILRIGVHFLIRELYRNNILTHKGGYFFCYVPTEKLRRLFIDLRWIEKEAENWEHSEFSTAVFQFLCREIGEDKAIFRNCFDIPLQVIARKKALQRDFFGKTLQESRSG